MLCHIDKPKSDQIVDIRQNELSWIIWKFYQQIKLHEIVIFKNCMKYQLYIKVT